MKKVLLLIVFICYSFAYEIDTDNKNIYFISSHFRVIVGISYKNSSTINTLANKLLDIAEECWQKEIVELGFKPPRNSDIKKIDIYIANKSAYNYKTNSCETISSNYAGWATSYPSDNTPYFILNPNLTDNQFKVTLAHEFFHTIQYAYFDETKIDDNKWQKNIWWLEATAVLIEDEVYDDINDYINFLDTFFNKSYKSIEIYDGNHEYAMSIFAKFIREKFGFEIIKKTFMQIETSGDKGYFEILDDLLKNDFNTSMQNELSEFAKWVIYKDKFFEEGSLYPSIKTYKFNNNLAIEKGGILVIEDLVQGWNLTALPNTNISSLKIDGIKYIWSYENNFWENNISNDTYNDINQTFSNKGYWLYSDTNNSKIYFTSFDNSKFNSSNLYNGWNLVSSSKKLLQNDFNDIKIVWKYIDGKWYGYSTDNSINDLIKNNYDELNEIDGFRGFWVFK